MTSEMRWRLSRVVIAVVFGSVGLFVFTAGVAAVWRGELPGAFLIFFSTIWFAILYGEVRRASPDVPVVSPPVATEAWGKGRLVARAGEALLGVGLVAFLAGFAVSTIDHAWLDSIELPLGDAQGLAVDADGRAYVASRAYRRIQRYDASGAFDRSWHLPGGKGKVVLAPDTTGGVQVEIAGAAVARIEGDRIVDAGSSPPAIERRHVDGEQVHRLEAGWMRPLRVVRVEGDEEHVVISQSTLLWLLQAPLPAWLLAAAGIATGWWARAGVATARR